MDWGFIFLFGLLCCTHAVYSREEETSQDVYVWPCSAPNDLYVLKHHYAKQFREEVDTRENAERTRLEAYALRFLVPHDDPESQGHVCVLPRPRLPRPRGTDGALVTTVVPVFVLDGAFRNEQAIVPTQRWKVSSDALARLATYLPLLRPLRSRVTAREQEDDVATNRLLDDVVEAVNETFRAPPASSAAPPVAAAAVSPSRTLATTTQAAPRTPPRRPAASSTASPSAAEGGPTPGRVQTFGIPTGSPGDWSRRRALLPARRPSARPPPRLVSDPPAGVWAEHAGDFFVPHTVATLQDIVLSEECAGTVYASCDAIRAYARDIDPSYHPTIHTAWPDPADNDGSVWFCADATATALPANVPCDRLDTHAVTALPEGLRLDENPSEPLAEWCEVAAAALGLFVRVDRSQTAGAPGLFLPHHVHEGTASPRGRPHARSLDAPTFGQWYLEDTAPRLRADRSPPELDRLLGVPAQMAYRGVAQAVLDGLDADESAAYGRALDYLEQAAQIAAHNAGRLEPLPPGAPFPERLVWLNLALHSVPPSAARDVWTAAATHAHLPAALLPCCFDATGRTPAYDAPYDPSTPPSLEALYTAEGMAFWWLHAAPFDTARFDVAAGTVLDSQEQLAFAFCEEPAALRGRHPAVVGARRRVVAVDAQLKKENAELAASGVLVTRGAAEHAHATFGRALFLRVFEAFALRLRYYGDVSVPPGQVWSPTLAQFHLLGWELATAACEAGGPTAAEAMAVAPLQQYAADCWSRRLSDEPSAVASLGVLRAGRAWETRVVLRCCDTAASASGYTHVPLRFFCARCDDLLGDAAPLRPEPRAVYRRHLRYLRRALPAHVPELPGAAAQSRDSTRYTPTTWYGGYLRSHDRREILPPPSRAFPLEDLAVPGLSLFEHHYRPEAATGAAMTVRCATVSVRTKRSPESDNYVCRLLSTLLSLFSVAFRRSATLSNTYLGHRDQFATDECGHRAEELVGPLYDCFP